MMVRKRKARQTKIAQQKDGEMKIHTVAKIVLSQKRWNKNIVDITDQQKERQR